MASEQSPSVKRGKLIAEIPEEDVSFVGVRILDANLAPMDLPKPDDLGRIEVELPLGLYEVTFKIGDATHSEYASLREEGATVYVRPHGVMRPTSSVPLFGTRTTHEFHAYPARDLSHAPPVPVAPGADARLLVFVRDPTDNTPGHRARGLTLHTLDDKLLFDFEHSAQHDDQARWAGAHLALPADTYLLSLTRRADWRWAMPLVVRPGFQTQAFFVCHDSKREEECDRYAELTSMTVLMSPDQIAYDPDLADFRRTDAALAALSRGMPVASADRRAMLGGKFDNPMLGIYGAHLLIWQDWERNVGLIVDVIGHLHQLLGRHPDVDALRLGLAQRMGTDPLAGAWTIEPLDTLPMLHRSWKRWVEATETRPELIAENSPADRISIAAAAMGPWLSWSLPHMARLEAPPRTNLDSVEKVFSSIRGILHADPELLHRIEAVDPIEPLQRQIALSLVPTVQRDIRELVAAAPRTSSVFGRVQSPERQAQDLTDRFHVPRGTAVRAAKALLATLERARG